MRTALEQACHEMMEGLLDEHIVVDALQGGAGTSTNMNVNEVLANRALQLMGLPLGSYDVVSPLDHVNLHQSTNDTYPTALKVAAIRLLRELERDVIQLLEEFQRKERATADVVKVGRTQLQDAVLTTVGREMSAYAEAFARDRWRIYKCEERLRVVNLGGTAIGTGLAAPRRYIFRVIEHLRDITNLGLARAENMVEATQNTDVFVEVSGILKACASNLLKIASDIRLLSSGPGRRLRRHPHPGAPGGLLDHAGQGQPGHPRGGQPGGDAGDGQRPGHLHGLQPGQPGAERLPAAHRRRAPGQPGPPPPRLRHLHPLLRERHRAERATHPPASRRRHGHGHGAGRAHRLPQGPGSRRTARSDEGKPVREVVVEMGLLTAEEFDELTSPEAVTRLGSPEAEGFEV